MMDWKRWLLLPLTVALTACSMDGGSSGTGVTTVEGNVSSIQLAAAVVTPSDAPTAVEGITVAVEGAKEESTTDPDGRFVVRGQFGGYVTLLFQQANDTHVVRLDVVAPFAGTVTLRNVQLDLADVQAIVESQYGVFDALVERSDCDHTLSVVSPGKADSGVSYTLDLDTSSLHDRQGNPVACAQLTEGDRLRVRGFIDSSGNFGSADVEVKDPS